MSGYQWDDQNANEDTPLVKQLRDLIKQRDDALKSRDDEITKLSGKVRTQSVTDILRGIGAKPGLAKFVPEKVEISEDNIKAWLKENEDIFGPYGEVKSGDDQSKGEPSPQNQNQPTGPGVTPETVAAFGRMQNADNGGSTLPDIEQSQQAQLAAMAQAANGDPDKYLAFLRGDLKL